MYHTSENCITTFYQGIIFLNQQTSSPVAVVYLGVNWLNHFLIWANQTTRLTDKSDRKPNVAFGLAARVRKFSLQMTSIMIGMS